MKSVLFNILITGLLVSTSGFARAANLSCDIAQASPDSGFKYTYSKKTAPIVDAKSEEILVATTISLKKITARASFGNIIIEVRGSSSDDQVMSSFATDAAMTVNGNGATEQSTQINCSIIN